MASTERQFQRDVVDLCKTLGYRVYHTHDSRRSEPGFPDLVIVGHGKVLYRELKTLTGRISPAQLEWMAALMSCGQDAAVWTPDHWPGRILAELRGD